MTDMIRNLPLDVEWDETYLKQMEGVAKRAQTNGRPQICIGEFLDTNYSMRLFDVEYENAIEMQKKGTVVYNTLQSALVHTTIPELKTLREINLREIANFVNKIHWDRVLYATIVSESFKTVSVHIMISDLNNQVCRLCLYNYINDYKRLRPGTCIAVLAPYMKHSQDNPKTGALLLRCDHPDGIVVFDGEVEWRIAIANRARSSQ